MEFIDIHSHILPGLDDGSQSISMSIEMARVALTDHIGTMVATPHIKTGRFDYSKRYILQRVDELNQHFKRNDVDLQVLPGAEYYLEPDLPQRLADGDLLTINNTGRYLLIELPSIMVPEHTERILYEIQLQGVIPIIAHPERNEVLAKRPDILSAYSKRGILAQVTSTSITGLFGRRVAKAANKMVADGSVQILASDAHTPNKRAPLISEAYHAVERLWGDQYARRLGWQNPKDVISGRAVEHVRPPRKTTLSDTIQRSFQQLMSTGDGGGRH